MSQGAWRRLQREDKVARQGVWVNAAPNVQRGVWWVGASMMFAVAHAALLGGVSGLRPADRAMGPGRGLPLYLPSSLRLPGPEMPRQVPGNP